MDSIDLTTPFPRVVPASLAHHLEVITRAVFSAGLNERVVDARWDALKEAFADFEPDVVAQFGPDDIARLVEDDRMIRSLPKIFATVANAQELVELERGGGYEAHLAGCGSFDARVAELKRRFRGVGDFAAYYILVVTGEAAPPYRAWTASRRTARGSRAA
jgi:3-methyladenine DNA glycosylase Tag